MPCPFRNCADTLFGMPRAPLLIMLAAAGALVFAFLFQYGFGYQPCILCLWQRAPFAVGIILAGLALVPRLRPYAAYLFGLCALVFFISVGLAIFHTGVERHWWLGTEGCAITPLSGKSVEDLRTQLLHTVTARCDEIAWTFLGLSMANYNVMYSLLLALFSLGAAGRAKA